MYWGPSCALYSDKHRFSARHALNKECTQVWLSAEWPCRDMHVFSSQFLPFMFYILGVHLQIIMKFVKSHHNEATCIFRNGFIILWVNVAYWWSRRQSNSRLSQTQWEVEPEPMTAILPFVPILLSFDIYNGKTKKKERHWLYVRRQMGLKESRLSFVEHCRICPNGAASSVMGWSVTQDWAIEQPLQLSHRLCSPIKLSQTIA